MKFSWLLGMLFLSQQMNMPDSLLIINNGRPIMNISPTDFSINLPGVPMINTEKFYTFMDNIEKSVSKKPVNAFIDKDGHIIPEQVGYRFNREAFTEKFYAHYFNNDLTQLEVPLSPIYPEIDSELLGTILSEKIGTYVTTFNTNNKKRTNNIFLAVQGINNYIVFPGETFSFNQVVGQRTVKKGYLPAPVFINGRLSEDIGGGVCQVSSTLFNAVDNAGLQVIQRFPHSRKVSYIPTGRDATVSWNGPDFVFKNIYHQPILIQAHTLENKLTIEIYSSDVINYIPKKAPRLPHDQKYRPK